MKMYPFAIAAGAVLGTAAVLVGSGTAANEHQSNTATQQLLINQRISQAAVKRSTTWRPSAPPPPMRPTPAPTGSPRSAA